MIWTALLGLAIANQPADVIAVDHIQAIEIEESFPFNWNAKKDSIDHATILVLEVSEDKTGLPQVGAPVLYIGSTPAARINPGEIDRHIVVFVEGHPDLSKTPIFWGPDILPEQVTTDMGLRFQAMSGQAPFPAEQIRTVTQGKMTLQNEAALYGYAAGLVETFAPGDKAFVRGIRVTMEQ